MFTFARKPHPSSAPSPAPKPARQRSFEPRSPAPASAPWSRIERAASKADGETEASPRVAPGPQFDFSRISVLPPIQRKATVSVPGDPYEREADEVADQVMRMAEPGPAGPPPGAIMRTCSACEERETIQREHVSAAHTGAALDTGAALRAAERGGEPLPRAARDFFEPRFGQDFSQVRVHTDGEASDAARAVQARAYTVGRHIVFGAGEYAPGTAAGMRLLAHELSHVVLGAGRSQAIARKTKGEVAVDKAHTDWLDPDANVKADVDVIKVALREIKRGKSVEYNRDAAKKKIASALTTLGTSKSAAVEAEWDWLVNERASAGTAKYKANEKAFFAQLTTPLSTLSAKHGSAQTKYWLKNTPPQVMDVIYAVADQDMPADQLWCYAFKEGLVDYVRDEIGLSKTADPTMAQLKGVSTTKTISGFDYVGTDDFWADYTAKKEPLSGYLPKGYDLTKVTRDPRVNEKGRTVESAQFPDLKMGLQALSAYMKRRRALFLADVKTYGYTAPTKDELVYWTYVYYNVGEFNGQLKKYKGKRKLSDWINNREYSNAIKVLESYRMITAMKIF
ncbi:eCIS core domain-containing protein [Sorangium sp. So ce394]|uniref:eCIS core domain-containing protein n=1 Tax=Sorangium sp. So ce394 TaxID=3133310 RepID=UPI003F5B3EE3